MNVDGDRLHAPLLYDGFLMVQPEEPDFVNVVFGRHDFGWPVRKSLLFGVDELVEWPKELIKEADSNLGNSSQEMNQ